MEKKGIKIIILFVAIVLIFSGMYYIFFMGYGTSSPNPNIKIECLKSEANDGIYYEVTSVNNDGNDYDILLVNFKLFLHNSSGEKYTGWDVLDIINNPASNPLNVSIFRDNDGDELMSKGDTIFIPLSLIVDYDAIHIYYYPTDEGCFDDSF